MQNDRILEEAEYMITTGATVRDAAEIFNISKTTLHKDITKRLEKIDFVLYKEVQEILKYNLSERHLRGGRATKMKYEGKKKLKV